MEQKESLKRLGWDLHTNPDMPNYIKFLTSAESKTSAIASEFVKVLSKITIFYQDSDISKMEDQMYLKVNCVATQI